MSQPIRRKLGDLLTQVLALGLAAGCLVFAGHKVLALRALENPPADMGLNFPPAKKRKIITDDGVLVDPLVTGSTASPGEVELRAGRTVQPYTADAPIQEYRLLSVMGDIAFVEVLTLRGREILPMAEGTHLPGAGPVERIARVDGQWILRAGDVVIREGDQ